MNKIREHPLVKLHVDYLNDKSGTYLPSFPMSYGNDIESKLFGNMDPAFFAAKLRDRVVVNVYLKPMVEQVVIEGVFTTLMEMLQNTFNCRINWLGTVHNNNHGHLLFFFDKEDEEEAFRMNVKEIVEEKIKHIISLVSITYNLQTGKEADYSYFIDTRKRVKRIDDILMSYFASWEPDA